MTSSPTPQRVSIRDFDATAARVRNWGRWGADDQIGTLNFITPDVVRESSELVRDGRIFPLGVKFHGDGVWDASGMRRNPIHLFTVDGGDGPELGAHLSSWPAISPADAFFEDVARTRARCADDVIIMNLQCATQWDALSHVWYDGQLYNGFPESSVTSRGATRNGIEHTLRKGIVSRAIMLDVARHRGLNHLPSMSPISPEELDDVCRAHDIVSKPGDIVLIRTGWWSTFEPGTAGATWLISPPGLEWRVAEWLHARQVAAVAADNASVEVGGDHAESAFLPLHMLCLRDMGLMLGEMWDLDELAADCARDGRYEFQVVATPLNIPGAVGTPLNPIALK